jgi:hypothetical protein
VSDVFVEREPRNSTDQIELAFNWFEELKRTLQKP